MNLLTKLEGKTPIHFFLTSSLVDLGINFTIASFEIPDIFLKSTIYNKKKLTKFFADRMNFQCRLTSLLNQIEANPLVFCFLCLEVHLVHSYLNFD